MSAPPNGNGSSVKLQLLIGVAAVAIALVIGFIGAYISPMNQRIGDCLEKIERLQNRVTEGEREMAIVKNKFTEIETQFRAEDQIRNIQWADMRRTLALIYEKATGEHYPSEIQFYPSIAQPSK